MSDSPSQSWVPLSDPHAENAVARDAILAAMTAVLDSSSYILGPHVTTFEAEMAAATKVAGSVGVASGTDALVLALLAAGVGVNDEVIAPSHTAGPTIAAIRMIGAVPVLVDIDETTYCIDAACTAAAVTKKNKGDHRRPSVWTSRRHEGADIARAKTWVGADRGLCAGAGRHA